MSVFASHVIVAEVLGVATLMFARSYRQYMFDRLGDGPAGPCGPAAPLHASTLAASSAVAAMPW
jgi:hypothetical protein